MEDDGGIQYQQQLGQQEVMGITLADALLDIFEFIRLEVENERTQEADAGQGYAAKQATEEERP